MTNDMIQLLVNTDQNLLLYLNGFHNAFGDYFMSTFTGKWIWVPMYASILYVLLKNFNWKITLCCLTAIALTILFADQVCASLIRPAVERLFSSKAFSTEPSSSEAESGRKAGLASFSSR